MSSQATTLKPTMPCSAGKLLTPRIVIDTLKCPEEKHIELKATADPNLMEHSWHVEEQAGSDDWRNALTELGSAHLEAFEYFI